MNVTHLDERLRGDLSTVAVVVGGCLFRSCIFVLIILFAGSLTGLRLEDVTSLPVSRSFSLFAVFSLFALLILPSTRLLSRYLVFPLFFSFWLN